MNLFFTNGIIISKESFNISTTTRPGKKNLKIHSVVLAHCLHDGITLDRSSPYAISYPMWVKERISIMDCGTDWALANDEYYIENPSFYYSYASHSDGKVGEILHEIKHTKDHIPVELIHDYWNSVDEIKARSVNKLNISCKDKKGN